MKNKQEYFLAKKIITRLMRTYDQGLKPKPESKRNLVIIRNYLAQHLKEDLTKIRVEERAKAVLIAKYSKDAYIKKLLPYWTSSDYDFSETIRPYIEIENKLRKFLDNIK